MDLSQYSQVRRFDAQTGSTDTILPVKEALPFPEATLIIDLTQKRTFLIHYPEGLARSQFGIPFQFSVRKHSAMQLQTEGLYFSIQTI